MRILEVNKFHYPRRGTERHFLDLIALLESHGHEVAVFAMDDPRNVSEKYAKYAVSAVGYNRDDSTRWQRAMGIGRLFWSFEARAKMRALLDEFRPDIVHIHNAYHQLSLSFLPIIRRRGIPIIQTVHDYHLISPDKDEYYPSVGRAYWKFLFVPKYGFGKRLLLVLKSSWERLWGFRDMVDAYIAPSRFVKEALVRGGIPESKITVFPHFVASVPAVAAEMKPSEPYALYFGGITEEKNIRELAAIFEKLRFRLVLAGARRMDIPEGPYVDSVGEKTEDELRSLIAGSSFVVSASRLPETFGLIVLEANIQGKPFFGYATGAFPEIVAEGKNGMLAADAAEFEGNITRFIDGGFSLQDSEVIRSDTSARFGSERYLATLIAFAEDIRSAKARNRS